MHNFFLKAESAWAKVVSDDLARWIDDGGSSTEFNLRATESFYKAFAYCHCRLIEHKPHTAAQANRVLIGEDVFNMVNRLRNKFNSVRDEEYKNKKMVPPGPMSGLVEMSETLEGIKRRLQNEGYLHPGNDTPYSHDPALERLTQRIATRLHMWYGADSAGCSPQEKEW